MNIDWTAVLVALLGSNLVLEIWKTIKESIQKRRRLDVESEINSIKKTVNDLKITINDQFTSMNKKLEGDYERLNAIESTLRIMSEVINRTSKGTILSLQNDSIIFNALRTNHINGESEKQEKKLDEFYKECAEFNLQMHA